MFRQTLFKQIDNSALIVFRICFGLLIIAESFGAILTGWVKRVFIDPKFTFSFIGFEWLQPLPGNGMYIYFIVMGLLGIGVLLGYRYRLSILGFALMWAGVYLMQKSAYNNHYYLLMLLSWFMVFVPANKHYSLDVKRNPSIKSIKMSQWCAWIFILQMAMVYVYAAIAKMYPDWVDGTFISLLLKQKADYVLVGDMFQEHWFHMFIAYSGIIFDFLIIPLLLIKRTRMFAFYTAIFFHIFNSIVFQIGVFPYLALAMSLFFFESKTIQKLFLKRKEHYTNNEVIFPKNTKLIVVVLVIYFGVQDLFPWRHWVIKDNVLWTEEGHRLSWRMMLRSKSGHATFKVIDKERNLQLPVKLDDYLTNKQKSNIATKPDFIWQFAQYLKEDFKDKGYDVKVFVDSYISVNGRPLQRFVDPEINLAEVKWNTFKHSDWILPSNLN